jgi:hypothetical protein
MGIGEDEEEKEEKEDLGRGGARGGKEVLSSWFWLRGVMVELGESTDGEGKGLEGVGHLRGMAGCRAG